LAIAVLTGFYIWTSHNRYHLMAGAEGVAYEVDGKTGQSWMLRGANKVPHKEASQSQHKEQELPYGEASKITGNAGLQYETLFSGTLYNGSSWVVTRVIIEVSAKEANGTVRWTRDFSTTVTIEPLRTGEFAFQVPGAYGLKEAPWSVVKVFGYKD
jgi:hypothetical protein